VIAIDCTAVVIYILKQFDMTAVYGKK